jgi:hypothetical protein
MSFDALLCQIPNRQFLTPTVSAVSRYLRALADVDDAIGTLDRITTRKQVAPNRTLPKPEEPFPLHFSGAYNRRTSRAPQRMREILLEVTGPSRQSAGIVATASRFGMMFGLVMGSSRSGSCSLDVRRFFRHVTTFRDQASSNLFLEFPGGRNVRDGFPA